MLSRYGGIIYRFKWWFVAASLLGLLLGINYARGVYDSLSQGGFDVPNSQSAYADTLINKYLGGNRSSLVVLISSPTANVDDQSFKSATEKLLVWLGGQPGVTGVISYSSTGNQNLVSRDRHATYILSGLSGSDDQQATAADRLSKNVPKTGLKVQFGGDAMVNAEAARYAQQDLSRAEKFIFPLTAILLIAIFGGLVAAGLPLIMGGYGIVGALVIARLATHATNISTYVINLISLLGMGLAIDYSLFVVSRFREELNGGADTERAVKRTMQTAGRTIIFSALTVLIALLGLIIFPVGYLRSMGVGGAAAVFIAVIGALTLLPALLAILGHRVNALSLEKMLGWRPRDRRKSEGNWAAIAKFVLRWPLVTVLVTLAVLLTAGLPFLSIRFINPSYLVLPKTSQARAVGQALAHDFPFNSQSPIQVVVRTNSGSPADLVNLSRIERYAESLQKLKGVSSLDNPLVAVPRSINQLSQTIQAIQSSPKQRQQLQQFIGGNYVLINIVPQNSASQTKLVHQVRSTPVPGGLERWVGGQPANLADLLATIRHYGVYALIVVLGGMTILLFLMLGSIVIPLKTILLNILSLSAAFGALVWVFQQGHLVSWFGASPVGGIDATQPVLIFALAFGLSMDYAVFLFSRVKERFDQTADIRQATIWGIQKTGGIITSAALLLLIVVGAFATGSIVVMKEVSIGLIVAVTVDVLIVRLLLVPSSMVLLGRYNWWAPGPLKRLQAKIGLQERMDE